MCRKLTRMPSGVNLPPLGSHYVSAVAAAREVERCGQERSARECQVPQGDEHVREYIRGVCRDIGEMLKSLPDDDTLRLSEFSNRVGAIGNAEPNLSGGASWI